MSPKQLEKTAARILKKHGLPQEIFFGIIAVSVGGNQGVGAQVSMPYDLPDPYTTEKARDEFRRVTRGAELRIY